MTSNDSSAADRCGKPSEYTSADLDVRADRANDQIVVELADHDGDGFILRIEPAQGLELALRVVAAVAKLLKVEQ